MLTAEESKEIAKQFKNYSLDLNNKQKENLYTYKFECTGRIINYILNGQSIIITRFIR